MLLQHHLPLRHTFSSLKKVFRTKLNIYGEAFFPEKLLLRFSTGFWRRLCLSLVRGIPKIWDNCILHLWSGHKKPFQWNAFWNQKTTKIKEIRNYLGDKNDNTVFKRKQKQKFFLCRGALDMTRYTLRHAASKIPFIFQ